MSNQYYTYSNNPGVSASGIDQYGLPVRGTVYGTRSDSADLPAIVIDGHDDAGQGVRMTLKPEAGISTSDLTKIMMMVIAVIGAGSSGLGFNPLAYIKKHNLERHFTYS